MLTADNRITSEAVARKLTLTEIGTEVLSDQKYSVVRRLHNEGWVVAKAGEGVNDAPELADADVGIVMGTGTGVAMHSAGVTLVKGDFAGIARARDLSRATTSNIRRACAVYAYEPTTSVALETGKRLLPVGVIAKTELYARFLAVDFSNRASCPRIVRCIPS